jgi:T5SS/PEP-CTERM-associated repeat protein
MATSKRIANVIGTRSNTELRIVGWAVIAFLIAAPGAVRGQTFWVNDGVGNWMVSSNWSDGRPGSGDTACINNGGTAQLFDPFAEATELRLGAGVGTSGNLEILGGQATFYGTFVGGQGAGAVKILNGGTLFASIGIDASAVIATNSGGSSGAVVVDGAQSKWLAHQANFFVGYGGTGTMSVLNGGLVASNLVTSGSIPAPTEQRRSTGRVRAG